MAVQSVRLWVQQSAMQLVPLLVPHWVLLLEMRLVLMMAVQSAKSSV